MKTTTLRVRVYDPSGIPAIGASVRASLTSVGVGIDGYVERTAISATTDDQGMASLELWPSTEGSTGSEYRIVARGSDGRKLVDDRVSVPDSVEPVWLQDIVMTPPPTDKPYDEASIDAIRDNRVLAQAARVGAEDSEGESRQILQQVRGERETVVQKAGSASQSASAAQDSESLAGQHEQEAGLHKEGALTAKQGAESALSQTEGTLQSTENARDQALSIYGDAQAQQQAVADAQSAAQTSTTKATQATDSADRALQSENKAVAKASEAVSASGQASSYAAQTKIDSTATASDLVATNDALQGALDATGQAIAAKQDTQGLAQQVTVDAGLALDRSADLVFHANNIAQTVSGNIAESEQTIADALSIYGSVQEIEGAVQETYFNRASINIQIATNMIMLRA